MNNNISQAKYPILIICKRLQILKNVFIADFLCLGVFLPKREI